MHKKLYLSSNREDQGRRGEKIACFEDGKGIQSLCWGYQKQRQGNKRIGEFRKDFLKT